MFLILQERTDGVPKCAFEIDSLLPEDRACINSFGIEPHGNGICDGGEQMKVSLKLHMTVCSFIYFLPTNIVTKY